MQVKQFGNLVIKSSTLGLAGNIAQLTGESLSNREGSNVNLECQFLATIPSHSRLSRQLEAASTKIRELRNFVGR